MMLQLTLFELLLSVVIAKGAQQPFLLADISDLDYVHSFSPSETTNFKTMTLGRDGETLFIGARDKIFGQKLNDIRVAAFNTVTWPSTKKSKCVQVTNYQDKCFNQIQVIHQLNDTHAITCGSNFRVPENRLLFRANKEDDFELVGHPSSVALCSVNPDDNVTSLLLEGENANSIFSTRRDTLESELSLMKLGNGSTLIAKNEKSADPKYVASFTAIDKLANNMRKIYTISLEKAYEKKSDNKALPTPTVVQTCVNDIGGVNMLSNTWTSLLKLRLSCATTTDEYPLIFSHVTDMVMGSNGVLYGTFHTPFETSRSNAVCSFLLSDIQSAFHGNRFWNTRTQPYSDADSSPLSPYHPGMCAYPGMDGSNPEKSTSKDFPDDFLSFMSSNFLVQETVKQGYSATSGAVASVGPLFVKSGEKFTNIAVQKVANLTKVVHDVLYVGKSDGRIHKLVAIEKENTVETIEIAIYRPTQNAIISMVLSQDKGQLYIGTETAVHQISTTNCAAYTKSCDFCSQCEMCVLARDPACGWDTKAQACVLIKNGDSSTIKQDIYYGDASTQCGPLPSSSPESVQVSEGATATLGNVITNPTVKANWYKYDSENPSAKKHIKNKDKKYRIKMDGQLQVINFDSSSDAATYECQYTIEKTILNVSSYSVAGGSSVPSNTVTIVTPVTVSSRGRSDGTTGVAVVSRTQTTAAIAMAGPEVMIGLSIALALVLIFVVGLIIYFKKRRIYAPGHKSNAAVTDNPLPDVGHKANSSSNNNTDLARVQSEYDDRQNRPLLDSKEHQNPAVDDVKSVSTPSPNPRNAKSLDDILDNRDELEYIDEDVVDGGTKVRKPSRQSSLRENSGRQRVPPARTKSMPGSALYVVYGGKKLMCSTLQRNKQGNLVVELQPNQSGMSDMATTNDEVIDIINDDVSFLPSPAHTTATDSKLDSASKMKDARRAFFEDDPRRAFFEDDPRGSHRGNSPTVQYLTSTPNPPMVQKPKAPPKPPGLVERAASMRRPQLTDRPSPGPGSLHSFGQNSSDSDSTVKGSIATLKADDTPSPSTNSSPNSFANPKRNQSYKRGLSEESSFIKPSAVVSRGNPQLDLGSKKTGKVPQGVASVPYPMSSGSLDRSSASSDGDEQLHGRDKGMKKKTRNNPVDSPSKQSRTSQGSSSSGDYKSARSSMTS